MWLGPNTDHVVRLFLNDRARLQAGKSVVFFAWKPSTITEQGQLVSLLFPQCDTHADDYDDVRCAYEFQRFEKIAWTHVARGAPLAFEVKNQLL